MNLFNKNIEPKCEYCEHKDNCNKNGMTCRKYKYDPLERVPFKNAKLQEFSKDDFKL